MTARRDRTKAGTPLFFASPAAFRAWLAKHAASADELVVGFWKTSTGKPSMTWSESVDEALCFGWIDGVRKRIDDDSYQIRFSPRREKSVWSAINIDKYHALEAAGRMTEAGRRAYERRTAERSRVYSYEQPEKAGITPEELRRLQRNKKAWRYFESCAPSYRKAVYFWITSAKRPETRTARLAKLIEACAAGKRLY